MVSSQPGAGGRLDWIGPQSIPLRVNTIPLRGCFRNSVTVGEWYINTSTAVHNAATAAKPTSPHRFGGPCRGTTSLASANRVVTDRITASGGALARPRRTCQIRTRKPSVRSNAQAVRTNRA